MKYGIVMGLVASVLAVALVNGSLDRASVTQAGQHALSSQAGQSKNMEAIINDESPAESSTKPTEAEMKAFDLRGRTPLTAAEIKACQPDGCVPMQKAEFPIPAHVDETNEVFVPAQAILAATILGMPR